MKKNMSVLLKLTVFIGILSGIFSGHTFGAVPISTTSSQSLKIWNSVFSISVIEGMPLVTSGHIDLQSISCVFENYNACSFYSESEGVRKLYVAVEGSGAFMQSLADAGILVDEENSRMDIDRVVCHKNADGAECFITPSDYVYNNLSF